MLKRRLINRYTGIYKTSDAIDNLKIRVTLKKLYSIIQIPKFEKIHSASSNDEPSNDYIESIDLGWQEKIFSKTEIKYYEQRENCTSELEKRYHEMIKKNQNSNENRLIFTYIDEDNYIPRDLECLLNARKNKDENDEEFVEMHIMADLEPTVLLFTIKYCEHDGLFIVYPDFNDNENSYYLEIDQNSKQMYTYYMENISKISNRSTNKIKQKKKLDELMNETGEIVKKIINPPRELDGMNLPNCRILLLIEIVSAKNFEYDNIHVQYNMKLPKFMKLIDGALEGSTHSSLRNENMWHFGYCFSVVLDIEDKYSISATEAEKISINFDIISIDSLWQRERNEGATTLKLPLKFILNNFECDLQCLRYIHNGSMLIDMIERFFLGGIRTVNQRNLEHEEINNLYGNSTVSTGTLKIKVQQIRQIQDSRSINSQLQSIDTIIDSYHKAKAKLNL